MRSVAHTAASPQPVAIHSQPHCVCVHLHALHPAAAPAHLSPPLAQIGCVAYLELVKLHDEPEQVGKLLADRLLLLHVAQRDAAGQRVQDLGQNALCSRTAGRPKRRTAQPYVRTAAQSRHAHAYALLALGTCSALSSHGPLSLCIRSSLSANPSQTMRRRTNGGRVLVKHL
jgi:hypothetical protein